MKAKSMTPSSDVTTIPEERIAELGLVLPSATASLAAYVPAVRSDQYIYTSGQLPLRDGQMLSPGKVGAEISLDDARDAAQQCAINALAAVRAVTGGLAAVRRVVKVVGFVASAPEFTDQPQVINGASELLVSVFGPAIGEHARSAVGVAALPLNAPVEVEIIVEI
ncbi:conserved hypothetical protein (plasmid) [Rhodococcus jostii RHA1]|jgi:enamine deaminase RidA (YjgF/YER057c/UK114 family)|uniref:Uncharacterized protein n=1 Tax=Rhodococcus jostii (strain RHA1) TaxID=101510 RepID=Q0RVR0_RHOJR|nr:conserved hypothetical protein [Rhodococcus jostii RHA1]